ncbi:DUF2029 domain-containing protein [Mycobacterium sp. PS03-16]|uniref:glycosyltransferase 87 family protein n=1 Tax=Mycobacterium sp. PS03-16 TaxID=2559611 RepID=UPI00107353CA|nr:glycosyltransferase 87 family protein [Mycobacterium sp. PS03-16]TFV56107.1 DUF2029 domain-containing protein [Mycobacterium sp. PS03-16]
MRRLTTRRRHARWPVALSACAALCGVVVSGVLIKHTVTGYQLDLSVFRDAGAALLNGAPLYSADFPSTSGFRFIYPPFAAVVFIPLAWVPAPVTQVLWALLNLALVWWILRICLDRLGLGRPGRLALLALGPALLLEPVRTTFGFGQINIVLMALVVADCLRAVPRRLQGVCLGLAAAIKLTPAGHALVLLARRDTAAVVKAAAVFAATIALGFLVRPVDSLWFWLREFFKVDRAGGHEFSRNQALTGVLTRSGLDGFVKDVIWLTLALVIAATAYWAARRFAHSGEPVLALGVVALAVLLASPFAVNHHWVYCLLLVPLIIAGQYRSWRPALAVAFVAFGIGPHFLLEKLDGLPRWQSLAMQIGGNAQSLAATGLFIAAVVVARRRGRAEATVDDRVLRGLAMDRT